jgi:queuine tRNA-ribosyltransferase
MPAITYELLHQDTTSRARLGRVTTPHGAFDTPAFMPVGTQGTVKGLLPGLVAGTGAQIVLGNTYHLMLRPGSELIQRLGGLQRWTGWGSVPGGGPMLTDSGGFQVFSLANINRIDDDGVTFRSHVNGAKVVLTPEVSMRVQEELGADIIMAFDDCPPAEKGLGSGVQGLGSASVASAAHGADADDLDPRPQTLDPQSQTPDPRYAQRIALANARTLRWLDRCVKAHRASGRWDEQALFGIVQGGTDLDQRTRCAEAVTQHDLPGYAIGGVAVGEPPEAIASVAEHTADLLPGDRPRYLMGVGYERDLVAAVRAGVDMFDCVLPTRNGRNASAFTATGSIRLKNAKYAEDPRPIEAGCDCAACGGSWELGFGSWGADASDGVTPAARGLDPQIPTPNSQNPTPGFSRSYLRHLFQAREMLGPILVSLHNLRHFQRLLLDIRTSIRDNDWSGLARRWPVAGLGDTP